MYLYSSRQPTRLQEPCLPPSRRQFLRSLSQTALVLSLEDVLSLAQTQTPQNSRPVYNTKPRPAPKGTPSPVTGTPLGLTFTDVAKQSGLNAKTTFGGEHKNKFLLETTGCGVAFYDFDHDDWLDIFLVNGTTLQGFPKGQEPTNHLFKNNRDGTFTDITAKIRPGPLRLGPGLLRRRLQQRRLGRPLRLLLRPERPLPQQRQRNLHRRHRTSRPHPVQNPLELRLRLPRLRQGRPPRPLRRQLHRLRHQNRPHPRSRRMRLQRHPGRLRTTRPQRRQKHPLPQQRQRNLHRRQQKSRDRRHHRHLRPLRLRLRHR